MLYLRLSKTKKSYYYRRRIPKNILKYFGSKEELRISLKTDKLTVARDLCFHFKDNSDRLYFLLRTNYISETNKVALVESFLRNNLMLDLENLVTPSNVPCTLEQPVEQQVEYQSETSEGRPLLSVVEQYIKEQSTSKQWSDKTTVGHKVIYDRLLSILGENTLINSLTRDDLIEMRETLRKLPSNINKKKELRDLSLTELLKVSEGSRISVQTVNNYLSCLRSLFTWAFDNDFVSKNIATNLKIKTSKKTSETSMRSVYSHNDIARLFQALPRDNDKPERFWIPIIALYTGMRLNEICQLYREDIQNHDGIYCITINNEKDKTVKNDSSIRKVPVHPDLINIGFVDYVESMKAYPRLWMNLENYRGIYSQNFGKWYQEFNREYITKDKRKVFHSFRHTFTNQLKEAQVDPHIVAELLGHTHGSITFDLYGKRYQLNTLYEGISKLDYGIKLPQQNVWTGSKL